MKFSDGVINRSIAAIKEFNYNDNAKENYIQLLQDKNNIEENIFNNLHVYLNTPIADIILNDEEFSKKLVSVLFSNWNYINREAIQILDEKYDIEELLNRNYIQEIFTKNENFEYVNNGYYYIKDFFNIFKDNEVKKEVSRIYLFGDEKFSVYRLEQIPEEFLEEFIKLLDEEQNEKSYQRFINGLFNINDKQFEIIYSFYKDKMDEMPLKEKVYFVKELKNREKAKEFFLKWNFDKKLDMIINLMDSAILEFVSEDKVYEIFEKMIPLDNFSKILKILSPEYQVKAFHKLEETKQTKNLDYYLSLETIKKLFDEGVSFDDEPLYSLYEQTNDDKYLKYILARYKKGYYLGININIVSKKAFVEILTDEDKAFIANELAKKNNLFFPYNMGKEDYDDYFFNIQKKQWMDNLKENPDMHIFLNSNYFESCFSHDEQLEILKHGELTTFIEQITTFRKCFDNVFELLKLDKDLFHRLKNTKQYSSKTALKWCSSDVLKDLDKLLEYVDDDILKYFVCSYTIDLPKVKEYFFKNVSTNPELATSLELYQLLDDTTKKDILLKLNMKSFLILFNQVFSNNEIKKYGTEFLEVLYQRFDEFILEINNSCSYVYISDFCKKFDVLDEEHKKIIFDKLDNVNFYMSILEKNGSTDEMVINSVLKYIKKTIFDYETDTFKILKTKIDLGSYSESVSNLIISKMDLQTLFYTYVDFTDERIKERIFEIIKNDKDELFDERIILFFNKFFYLIDDEHKEIIRDIIDTELDNNELYNTIFKPLTRDMNLDDKINYLVLYKQGRIETNIELIKELLSNNPFLFKTIKSIIFNENIKNTNMYFISKLSKYKNVQKYLTRISNNEDKIVFINKVVNYLSSKITNKNVFDKEISMIIGYVSNDSKLVNFDFKNVNDNNLSDIISYILADYTNSLVYRFNVDENLINEMFEFDIQDYSQKKIEKCDELFKDLLDIDEMKNIYFNKYFSMSITQAKDFYQKYVYNYDKVVKYAENDIPLLFVSLLSKIININDPVTLRELYMSNDITFDITDVFEVEAIMSKAYNESLVNDYKDKQNGTTIKKVFKDNEGKDVEVEMTELLDNFGLLVHSTCAYGAMPLIDDDYFLSWNYNPNTENHGICCSYITNTSYGTAAVTDTGVMFGFTKLTSDSVAAYSPYDLATRNNGFDISCWYTPFCTLLDDISDYTRHTHNEFDLERRLPDGDLFCVQPDCIVITEDMDENIKANSIKAYNDFKNHGIDLKLIYIDRVKIANMEASKLESMIKEYSNSYDLVLLKEIINKYESNYCCTDFLSIGQVNSKELFDKDELFMTDTMNKLLHDTLERIVEEKDIEKLNYFVAVLNSEQFKFDLIDDKNPDRKHIFNLYTDELKEKIENAKKVLGANVNEKRNTI